MNFISKNMFSAFTALTMLLTGCAGGNSSAGSESEISQTEEQVMELTQKTFAADEQHVKLIGRTLNENGTLWLALSASGFEFTMTGTSASVTVLGDNRITSDTAKSRFAAYVDGEKVLDEMVTQEQQTFTIFTSETEKEVTIKLLKLSEAAESIMGISSIDVVSTGDIAPTAEKELKIEFIGDSITCGYGVDDEVKENHFNTETEDATKAYAYKTAMALDADYSLVSYSGHGIVSGYTTVGKKVAAQQVPNLYTMFARSYGNYNGMNVSSYEWDFSRFVPDLVVINLGTNDSSYTGNKEELIREYIDGYVKFLGTVREKNPDAHIICALGVMGDGLYNAVCTAVEEYSAATGDTKVSAFHFKPQDGSTGFAADWHPTAATHDIAAEAITAEIKTILGL